MRLDMPLNELLRPQPVEAAKREQDRCRCTIVLHGVSYRCVRQGPHDGIHDAQDRDRVDDGLVRW